MRQLLLPTMILAGLVALPATVEAQRGGGRGGGGAHVGGAHVGGAHVGGAHVGGAHVGGYHYGGYGYRGYGYGYPGYGFGIAYVGGGYYGSPYYSVYPTTVYSPTYVLPPTGPMLSPDYGGQGPTLPKNKAIVQVLLPDPEATLLFDGAKTSSIGRMRTFEPPELQPGVYYSYTLTASWMQGGQVVKDMRKVSVVGGQASMVDFTRPPPPEAVPLPKADKD